MLRLEISNTKQQFIELIHRGTTAGTIHPDSERHIASTREQLQNESEGEQSGQQTRASRRTHNRNDGQLTCPICLGSAVLAVETNCGHVFCGNSLIFFPQNTMVSRIFLSGCLDFETNSLFFSMFAHKVIL